MKYRDLTGPEAYAVLPRLDPSDIRYRWFDDFYDGPLSGMICYQGHPYWFENLEVRWAELSGTVFEAYGAARRFFVMALTPEQLAEEEYWHEEFRRYVGGFGDFDEEGRPVGRRGLQPEERHHLFYERYERRTPMDLAETTVIGWFEYFAPPPQGASAG